MALGSSRVEMVQCVQCEKATQHVRNEPSHLLHFLLSIILFGWWLVVWAFLCIFQKNPQCMVCGMNSNKTPASKILGWVLLLIFIILMCLFFALIGIFVEALDTPQ